ncbi:hypothetical protein OM076_28415 [Solirubrobacter ginsenosidimutans]|uniref:Uncharacterized protein n=1 Tax=Solirubrobacter ginsenosidimutans TaxID=490573 RepID=A0A9X3N3K7_9ACTN|nr:hypothetical protein [Solirubrobacter ginsenosidimutans]MDA0164228.1 hypothetical protein [Solirubrobacter ginsenosidimutans]
MPTQLLSRSCTTGWADWVWGDLWLRPDALVRVARGWDATRAAAKARRQRGGGSTVDLDMPVPSEAELRDRTAATARSRWIALDDIEQARLRTGLTTSRLAVVMRDGERMKLLWLKDDPAHDVLQGVLELRLGARLRLR